MLLLYRGEEFDPNFFYHSGVDIDHCFFISDGKRRILLTSKMNEALARSRFRGRIAVYGDAYKELARITGRKRVVEYDASSLCARMAGKLEAVCKLADHSTELLRIRGRKRPDEVAKVRRAVKETKEIFESLDLTLCHTELDLKKQLLMATLARGLEPAFEPIVSSDATTAYPHYRAGHRKLGGLVLVDYGVRYKHYCADLTRCFIRDGDARRKAEYEKLQDICFAIVDTLPRLHEGREIGALAARLMENALLPPLIHSIGHGVGLEVHEVPSMGLKSEDGIEKAAMAIEPAFYRARYGMRYEETVYYDGKRARIL